MSADNWTVCPKCQDNAREAAKTARQNASDAYGTASVEAWTDMHNRALDLEAKASDFKERNLREDYEIGIDGDDLAVQYRANCTSCKWSVHFTHDERVYP